MVKNSAKKFSPTLALYPSSKKTDSGRLLCPPSQQLSVWRSAKNRFYLPSACISAPRLQKLSLQDFMQTLLSQVESECLRTICNNNRAACRFERMKKFHLILVILVLFLVLTFFLFKIPVLSIFRNSSVMEEYNDFMGSPPPPPKLSCPLYRYRKTKKMQTNLDSERNIKRQSRNFETESYKQRNREKDG